MKTLAHTIVLSALAATISVQIAAGGTDGDSPSPDSGNSLPPKSTTLTNLVIAVQSPAHWLGLNASGLVLDALTNPRTATVNSCRGRSVSAEESLELIQICRALDRLPKIVQSQAADLKEPVDSVPQTGAAPGRRLRSADSGSARTAATDTSVAVPQPSSSADPFAIRALRISWWLPGESATAGEVDYIDYKRASVEARNLIDQLRDIAASGDALEDVVMIVASSEDRRFGPDQISYAELHRLGGRKFVQVDSAELGPDLANIRLAAKYPGAAELVDPAQLAWLRRSKGWSGEANLFEIDGHCLTIEAWLSPAFQFRPGSTPFRLRRQNPQPSKPTEDP